jgi:hypothetical protein
MYHERGSLNINPLNAELNPICDLLALLGARPILHVSRIRVKHETIRFRNIVVTLEYTSTCYLTTSMKNVSGHFFYIAQLLFDNSNNELPWKHNKTTEVVYFYTGKPPSKSYKWA